MWRYRFDLLASNLNSQGTSIGVFHGMCYVYLMDVLRGNGLFGVRGGY